MMAASDKGALQPAQISKKCLTGACGPVIDAEGSDSVSGNGDVELDGALNGTVGPVASLLHCGSVNDNSDVGPEGMSNEIIGSVRCALAGRDCCVHCSLVQSVQCGLGQWPPRRRSPFPAPGAVPKQRLGANGEGT